jgi:hypothetical protein
MQNKRVASWILVLALLMTTFSFFGTTGGTAYADGGLTIPSELPQICGQFFQTVVTDAVPSSVYTATVNGENAFVEFFKEISDERSSDGGSVRWPLEDVSILHFTFTGEAEISITVDPGLSFNNFELSPQNQEIQWQKIGNTITFTIVLAADNLMDFALSDFYAFYRKVDSCCVCVKEVQPRELPKMGIVLMDENNRIYDFEEKPKHPKSHIRLKS